MTTPAATAPPASSAPPGSQALDEALAEDWMTSRSLEELLPYVPRLRAIAKDIEQRAMADLGSRSRPFEVGRSWPPNPAASGPTTAQGGPHRRRGRHRGRSARGDVRQEVEVPGADGEIPYAPLQEDAKTKKEVKELVDKYAFQPQGAPKLAPESDPRPALEPATWTLEDALNASLEAHNETD
jgi:hypothetical protein